MALRLALTGATAGLLAGCANSERLSDPFGNPFQSSANGTDSTPTGSLGSYQQSAPVTPVQRHALGQAIPQPAAPPVQTRSLTAATVPVAPSLPRGAGGAAGWTIEGGTPIAVRPGESASVLAQRYGVPTESLVRANGFGSAGEIQPGTRVVIPVYNAALAASSGAHLVQNTEQAVSRTATAAQNLPTRLPTIPKPTPIAQAEPVKLVRNVAQNTTKSVVAETNAVKGAARAKLVQGHAQEQAVVQHVQTAQATVKSQVKPEAIAKNVAKAEHLAKPEPIAKAEATVKATAGKLEHAQVETKKAVKTAALAPAREARIAESKPVEARAVEPKQTRSEVKQAEPVKSAEPVAVEPAREAANDSANPEFRWPARGRIIQSFKPGGNDGINIAVPEGTAVKAAEGGVVAYAGSELKGYGNLVLIRHPNGFVSAYANNGDLEVKRGETVKRGQTIAKSGQSGNVNSPQLHFELRKGATPVDPTQYLAGL
ncbi:peptidoglycan DD-metalloendopeptidase family protein [Beijerinckia indica]|uniref:peptidoglycan DD-metalloendopeptidase family protein n=1 Tax=Beijerinckia indica TaxID=533 RepID=UPI00059F78D5|nr:peptidoglycan DD-metalloendopeptidase family protein [Beijerinckia indica]